MVPDSLLHSNYNSFFIFSFVTVKAHVHVVHTYSAERDKLVFTGVNGQVIGPISPHVSRAVDQPGGVQHQGVPQQRRDEVRYPQRLPPQVPRHRHGDKEAHEQHRRLVIPVEETRVSRKNGAVSTKYTLNTPLVRSRTDHSLTFLHMTQPTISQCKHKWICW